MNIHYIHNFYIFFYKPNDPTAGSPTVTLLRLFLPLNNKT